MHQLWNGIAQNYFHDFLKLCNRMFYFTAPPACSLLTILLLAQMYKLYVLYFPFPVYTTGSHYSRSISHSTVLRGSCLLYYRRSTCHCVCHLRSSLSATAIKEYFIVLYFDDRFWWHLAEIFKILQNRVCMLQFSCRFACYHEKLIKKANLDENWNMQTLL